MVAGMSSNAAAEGSLSAARIFANAQAMAPAIARRSEEIERLRRLPADLVADLRAAGFFRMGRSRDKGGPEMSLPQHLEVSRRVFGGFRRGSYVVLDTSDIDVLGLAFGDASPLVTAVERTEAAAGSGQQLTR